MRTIILTTCLTFLSATACDSAKKEPQAKSLKAEEKASVKADAKEAENPKAETKTKTKTADPLVVKALAVAKAVETSPGDADQILEKHGLDRDQLDTLMTSIASDPKLSAQYESGRTK